MTDTNGGSESVENVDFGPVRLTTGVRGLDAVLGGGVPEYSFNLIAGDPGAGKTTLAQQIAFANATVERPAVFFTVLGEPTVKMLRYQQGFEFFDASKVGSAVHFRNLSEETLEQDLHAVLDRIAAEVELLKPGIVIVDSFRTLSGAIAARANPGTMTLEHFVQRLALHLTTWEVTSFLIGEYRDHDSQSPIFTVADGMFWLSQVTDRNSVVRKLQVVKSRGHDFMPGLHTFRITGEGLQVFPRISEKAHQERPLTNRRLATGVPGLDDITGGGIPSGDVLMLAGPAGCGKTTFVTHFVAAGFSEGDSAVVVVFEEYPDRYLARATARHPEIAQMLAAGQLEVIYLKRIDLSVDETVAEILRAVTKLDATRVVIDSLSGFELALAPTFREDFRESLYRLVGALTAAGVTVMMTSELVANHPETHFTAERVSFITDNLIVQRFVEIDGALQKVLAVVKMRGSEHAHEFRKYSLTERGAVIEGPLLDYRGITTGIPRRMGDSGERDTPD